MDLVDVLEYLLTRPPRPQPIRDVPAWWRVYRQVAGGDAAGPPVHGALLAGFTADRPAYAFASGYQAAVQALLGRAVPGVGDVKWALCATEQHGNHPRAIRTRLEPDGDGYRLTGSKTWSTLGPHADGLLVFASEGQDEAGRNRIVCVRVPADRDGVTREVIPADELALVPEIPHARIRFDRVAVAADERLDGDGFTRYLRPFRTVEDCHVHAALAAWLVQVARRSRWPDRAVEELIALAAAVAGLAVAPPTSPAIHVALAGLLGELGRWLDRTDEHWSTVDQESRSRWQRDRALLKIAGRARERRREVAWERLRGAP